jgi:hypothetical protein
MPDPPRSRQCATGGPARAGSEGRRRPTADRSIPAALWRRATTDGLKASRPLQHERKSRRTCPLATAALSSGPPCPSRAESQVRPERQPLRSAKHFAHAQPLHADAAPTARAPGLRLRWSRMRSAGSGSDRPATVPALAHAPVPVRPSPGSRARFRAPPPTHRLRSLGAAARCHQNQQATVATKTRAPSTTFFMAPW